MLWAPDDNVAALQYRERNGSSGRLYLCPDGDCNSRSWRSGLLSGIVFSFIILDVKWYCNAEG